MLNRSRLQKILNISNTQDLRRVASLENLLIEYDDLMFKHDELWDNLNSCESDCEKLFNELEELEVKMESLRYTAQEEWGFNDLESGVEEIFRSHSSDDEFDEQII